VEWGKTFTVTQQEEDASSTTTARLHDKPMHQLRSEWLGNICVHVKMCVFEWLDGLSNELV